MSFDPFAIFFPDASAKLDEILAGLHVINRRLKDMPTAAEIQAQLDVTNTKLDGIQTDVTGLKQQIADLLAGGGATAAELQTLLDSATALAVKAGAIDDQTT